MDIVLNWEITEDVEKLVSTIIGVKNDLRLMCNEKWQGAKIECCDAYASKKVCQLLEASELWKPSEDEELPPADDDDSKS